MHLLLSASLACFGAASTSALSQTKPLSLSRSPSPPSFLFLITDDQDLELGGASAAAMPALHELIVNEGMTLSAAHTVSPICCPSRTSLFSGRYPHNLADDTLGWCGNFSKAMDDTWMTSLHDAGYTIMQSGKWFNSEASFCSKGWLPSWKRAGDANELFLLCEEGKYFNNTYNRNGVIGTASTGATTYMTSVLGNHTLEFLKTATRAAAPWVAYVGIHAPHLPATPAPWYADAPMPPHAPRTASWNTAWQDKHWVIDNGVDKPMSEALINGSDALHAQRLRTLLSVDDLVRDVVALLQANGALDNTYIIYTSDVRGGGGGGMMHHNRALITFITLSLPQSLSHQPARISLGTIWHVV